MLARQVMTLRTRLEQRNIHSARDRVRHYLAINADPSGRTVVLSGTLKDMAAELGLTHEALYRTLRGDGGRWRDRAPQGNDPSDQIRYMIAIIWVDFPSGIQGPQRYPQKEVDHVVMVMESRPRRRCASCGHRLCGGANVGSSGDDAGSPGNDVRSPGNDGDARWARRPTDPAGAGRIRRHPRGGANPGVPIPPPIGRR